MNGKKLLINVIDEATKQKYIKVSEKVKAHIESTLFPRGWQKQGDYKYTSSAFWYNTLGINPVADGHTFIIDFIPVNNPNIFIMNRDSNHPKEKPQNVQKNKTKGEPNKFIDIFFSLSDDYISPDGNTVILNANHLYADADVESIMKSIISMLENGEFKHPFISNPYN